jgi:LysM repeat protein
MCYHRVQQTQEEKFMLYKKYVLVVAIAALMISSCTMSYPGSSAATAVPTNPFTKPLATGVEPMSQIEGFATGTAMAKTAIAGGGPTATPNGGIPAVPTNTPLGGLVMPTNTPGVSGIPTNTPGASVNPTSTQVPVTGRPAQYTLQAGEFPYCIARRFNVNPDDLLSLNGLGDGSLYMPGTTLRIPQTGTFPGDRSLRPHPTTYTVTSSDETMYSIACLFGSVDPSQIAQANGIALGSLLKVGQTLNIP